MVRLAIRLGKRAPTTKRPDRFAGPELAWLAKTELAARCFDQA
jgi:hypothetical protein